MELCYTIDTAKLAYQGNREGRQAEPMFPQLGEHLCARTYTATGTTQTVIQRVDALLTPDEVNKHWPEVMSAIKQELETLVKYGCISRKKRNCSRDIIDVNGSLHGNSSKQHAASKSQQTGPANTKGVIRARLTVRGFIDFDARYLENYAGTSQRYSQRIIVQWHPKNSC